VSIVNEKQSSKHEHIHSKAAIAALVGGVALYDYLAPHGETISEGVDRLMETKLGKAAVYGIVTTTALHLLNVMPEKYDWLHRLTERKRP